jgi:4-amino-4-deoxy-L-arabinose transferase-like glycosyltransferase
MPIPSERDRPSKPATWQTALVGVLLFAAVAVLLATSPTDYDFYNPDAPRHALNGAFVLDAISDFPWRDPMGYAIDYYLRLPSLSIGFYPPLFYVAEAIVFAVLGVSHFAAQVTVALFALLLGVSAYRLARMLFAPFAAAGAALMLLGAPELAFWDRQVMLDIPVHAVAMLAIVEFVQHLRTGRERYLWFAAIAFTAALYIKFTVCFMLVPAAVGFVARHGWGALLGRRILLALGAFALLSLPALALTLKFGMVNLTLVGGEVSGTAITTITRWDYYVRALPGQLGWPVLALALPGSVLLWRRAVAQQQRWLAALLLAWLISGYLFFSLIREHETRHDLMLLFPIVLAACASIGAVLRARLAPLAAPATLLFGLGMLATAVATPVPRVAGYRAVADAVAKAAPPDAVVLFSAYRDGNFVFALRARSARRDIHVLRANKWLLHYAVEREWGVTEVAWDRARLQHELHAHGVALAVVQRGFWADLREMATLAAVLSDATIYRPVAVFPIEGDLVPADLGPGLPPCASEPCGRNLVDIIAPIEPLPARRAPIEIDLPFLQRRLSERQTQQLP